MGKEVFESLFLDQFENPLKTTNSRVKIDANGTNLSSSIVFGKKGVINCSASERLKYSYDKMGNISAIFKNGTLIVNILTINSIVLSVKITEHWKRHGCLLMTTTGIS